jgi:hypothetical protein
MSSWEMSGIKFDLVPTREELLKRKVQEQVMKGEILKKWEEMNKIQPIEEEPVSGQNINKKKRKLE